MLGLSILSVSDLQEEGKNAINAPMSPATTDLHPEDTLLEENEERTMIDPTSKEDAKFKELIKSEIGQKQKLQTVLEAVYDLLRPHGWTIKWSVDLIHGKNLVSILHLLVAMAMHFRATIRLPEHVSVQVVVVKKREGLLQTAHVTEEITTTTEMMMGRFERDAFDTLFDHAPDKLSVVKKSLITFVNKHLNKLNLEVSELESQVHNVSFSFELMQDAGLKKPKARPEDVVNLDLKSTLRVLYNLFTKYKNAE
ncbi:Beta-parvin, partial [Ophiophagus hannah]